MHATIEAGAAGRTATGATPTRDRAIDAARAGCLAVVFLLHAMMVGVSVGPGGPVLENALEGWDFLAPATWVVQIMPLFFLIGGFSGWTAWQRRRARGIGPASFVRDRITRLVRPAVPLVAVVGLALAALAAAGVPAEIVQTASFRIGQPLWFLAVYLGASALVPLMVRLHEWRPGVTIGALVAAVVAVDALRFATGVEALGFLNLAFVWLAMQQLGFLLADGTVDRMPVAARLRLAACALGGLLAITLSGPYTPDLLQNLNPPTICLVLLGTAQLALFSLVRRPLGRWAERRGPARAVASFGEWGMTMYLWHLPAFVLLAAGLLAANASFGLALPEPLSAEWWASRPLWLVGAAAVTALAVRAFARWERVPRRPAPGSGNDRPAGAGPAGSERMPLLTALADALPRVPAWLAVPAGVLGVGTALVVGFAPAPALVSLALLGVALLGARAPRMHGRAALAARVDAGMSVVGGKLIPQHQM
ncbi:acyltransferase [Agromyces mediolanus]|uniref:acyltransferase family protein n=1 Tax=Agromyces mediolanus TaxID=41986 RepID=UPI003835B4B5